MPPAGGHGFGRRARRPTPLLSHPERRSGRGNRSCSHAAWRGRFVIDLAQSLRVPLPVVREPTGDAGCPLTYTLSPCPPPHRLPLFPRPLDPSGRWPSSATSPRWKTCWTAWKTTASKCGRYPPWMATRLPFDGGSAAHELLPCLPISEPFFGTPGFLSVIRRQHSRATGPEARPQFRVVWPDGRRFVARSPRRGTGVAKRATTATRRLFPPRCLRWEPSC